MTCLSVITKENGPAKIVANPIYILGEEPHILLPDGTYIFEVLKDDAGGIYPLIGIDSYYLLDDNPVRGKITSLVPASPIHPALAALSHKPAYVGALVTVPEAAAPPVKDRRDN